MLARLAARRALSNSAWRTHTYADMAASTSPSFSIIFDMDGTITQPGSLGMWQHAHHVTPPCTKTRCTDFAEMRERTGVPPGGDIIGCIKAMPEEQRKAAFKVVSIALKPQQGLAQFPHTPHRCMTWKLKG